MADLYRALRECYSALEAANTTLREQIKPHFTDLTAEDWELIEKVNGDALKLAVATMDSFDRIKNGAEDPLGIKKWIRQGEFSDDVYTVRDLYEEAGGLLDNSCSHEIFGSVIFEGDDGQVYVMNVEGCLGEINPDYLKDVLAEDEEGDDDGSES